MQDGVVAIVRRLDQLLVIRRAEGVPFAGHWGLASGKVEAGESLAQALVREVREELGLEITPDREVWVCPTSDQSYRLHWWTAEVVGGTLRPDPREVAEVRWVAAPELERLDPLMESDRRFLREVWPKLPPPAA